MLDEFWPARAKVTQTKSRRPTRNFVEEVITQTTDVVSGSESVPSRPGINMTEQQSWKSDLMDSGIGSLDVMLRHTSFYYTPFLTI